MRRDSLHARARSVGPFELDSVVAKRAGLPSADVTDFAVGVVVPALPGNGIGDRLAEFVRGRRGKCVERRESAGAAGTARIGHYGVVDVAAESVVVTAERLARGAVSLDYLHAVGKVDEIKSIGIRGG